MSKKSKNPLFEMWLEEWKVEASNRNSKLEFIYSKV